MTKTVGWIFGIAMALLGSVGSCVSSASAQQSRPNFAQGGQFLVLLNPSVVDQLPETAWADKLTDALGQAQSVQNGVPTTPGLIVSGITADGAASVIVVGGAVGYGASGTFSVTGGASLISYSSNWRSFKPQGGPAMIAATPDATIQCGYTISDNSYCAIAILQAPDILQSGAGSGNQTMTVTLSAGTSTIETQTAQVLPPAVLLVHGLWGDDNSLAPIQSYLAGQSPWSANPGLLTNFSYDGGVAFDDAGIQSTLDKKIAIIFSTLSSNGIVAGRIDTVAHSMGGLVMRSYSNNGDYKNTQNRTLGAIHQIITLNTPEAGSKLASFLLANQNVPFSSSSTRVATFIADSGCQGAQTVGTCVAHIEGPVNSGAVASLVPGSANISRLPTAKIPNAVWNAFASTVNQQNTIVGLQTIASSLVWTLDELILATCPGAPYCPTSASKVPLVGTILGSSANDAIVTLTSQKAGCTSPCAVTTFPKLAHTSVHNKYIAAITNDSNVLTDTDVQAKVACALLGPCPSGPVSAPVGDTAIELASNGADPNFLPYTMIKAFPAKLPPSLALGQPFRLKVDFALSRTKFVSVRQFNDTGDEARQDEVPLEQGPDGKTYAVVTPLVMGHVQFLFNAVFALDLTSATSLRTIVGPPVTKPLHFWGDINSNEHPEMIDGTVLFQKVEQSAPMSPVMIWPTAPTIHVVPHKGLTFRLSSSADADIVSLDNRNWLTCRKAGNATIVVGYAGLTTEQKVKCLN